MSVAVFAAFLLLLLAFCAPLAAQHAPKKPFVESSWVAEMSYESEALGEGRIVFDLNTTDSKSSRALIEASLVEVRLASHSHCGPPFAACRLKFCHFSLQQQTSDSTLSNKTFAVDLERFRGTYMLSNTPSWVRHRRARLSAAIDNACCCCLFDVCCVRLKKELTNTKHINTRTYIIKQFISLSCNYAFNQTFASLFDLTSSGWLSGNLTVVQHSKTSTIWQVGTIFWKTSLFCINVFFLFFVFSFQFQ